MIEGGRTRKNKNVGNRIEIGDTYVFLKKAKKTQGTERRRSGEQNGVGSVNDKKKTRNLFIG